MVITTLLMFLVMRRIWNWSLPVAAGVTLMFFIPDIAFFFANFTKIAVGGWFPLTVGVGLFTLMTTWKRGREILAERLKGQTLPMDIFLQDVGANPPMRVSGTAVFMTGASAGVPAALLHNIKHNKVVHDRVVLLTITTEDVPTMRGQDRLEIAELGQGFWRVIARYGFMENPRIRDVLAGCHAKGLELPLPQTSFFLGRETLIPSRKAGMAIWREALFAWMSRNARSATAYFGIPPNRVVELGAQIEL